MFMVPCILVILVYKIPTICNLLCLFGLFFQVIEGKIKGEMEVARRRGRRRKKLLDDLRQERIFSFEGGGS